MVLRAPVLLFEPRFWAEEGTRYFSFAWAAHARGDWWASLVNLPTSISVGYYALWPNVASTLAAAVPLEQAPRVTTLFAFAVQLAVVAFWLWSRHDLWPARWQKAVGAAVLVLAPLSAEAWLNTINSQFFLVVLTLVVLFARTDTRAVRYAGRAALAVASLTGSLSCVLTPWFVERAWAQRSRERWIQAGVLGAGALLQAVVAVAALSAPDSLIAERAGLPPLATVVAVGATQSLGLVLGGIDWMRVVAADIIARGGLGAAAWLWLAGGAAVLFAISLGVPARDRARLLSLYVTLLVVVVATSLGDDKLALVPPGVAERYFMPANTLLMLILLAAAGAPSRHRAQPIILSIVLGWTLLQGAARFAEQPFVRDDWPRWRDEVARFRADPTHRPGVWPGGWSIEPPPR